MFQTTNQSSKAEVYGTDIKSDIIKLHTMLYKAPKIEREAHLMHLVPPVECDQILVST